MIEEMNQMILGLMDLVRTRMDYFKEQGMFNYQSKISLRLLICINCYFAVLQDHEAFANELRSELMEKKSKLDKSAMRQLKYVNLSMEQKQ